jgi:hypothetical protein
MKSKSTDPKAGDIWVRKKEVAWPMLIVNAATKCGAL